MSLDRTDAQAAWADAVLAAELFAVAPAAAGGILLRAWPGPPRERLCTLVRALLRDEAPMLRLPLHVTTDRLLGGLSLAATLRAGRVVTEQGLLAQAHGGVLVAAMAERLEPLVTHPLCAALDRGELVLERDGVTAQVPCALGVLALDEGLGEERVPEPLRDRLALHIDLTEVDPRSASAPAPDGELPRQRVDEARALLPQVTLDPVILEALCETALVLGIGSLRAPILAAVVARIHAALAGRTRVAEEDAQAAARLVLGPRATRLPDDAEAAEAAEDEKDGPEGPAQQPEPPVGPVQPEQADTPEGGSGGERSLGEIVLQAAKSAVPAGLLDALALGREPRTAPRSTGQAGAQRGSPQGGRPAGTRPGQPRSGERLNLVETLRAAAPWQPLRRREREGREGAPPRRIEIRKDDLRLTRFKQRTATSVIFCVDASGSAALQRLAEAKGAVEQVLADCYVRRDHVALIAFRGAEAALLLSPTRSLLRVRRCLAHLAGGGTTPLAAGIDAALLLALDARRRGQAPIVVLMTDGRGNVARDGRGDRAAAAADALSGARAVRAAGVRALFLDTSPRPRPLARSLADEMGARYLPLPYLDAVDISHQIQSLTGAP